LAKLNLDVLPRYNLEDTTLMNSPLATLRHFAFEVANLEEARQHLQAHDIAIVGGPRPRGDGVMQMYVRDPDGYIIELFIWQK